MMIDAIGAKESYSSNAQSGIMNGANDLQSGPCVVCGATNYSLSFGGPTICPACDCGASPPQAIVNLSLQNTMLRNSLDKSADREKRLEDVLDRTTVLLCEQYLLSPAEWRDRRKALVVEARALLAEQEKNK